MDESIAMAPNGAIWDHEVIVIVPKHLEHKNVSTVLLTTGSNGHPDRPTSETDENVLVVDEIAHNTRAIAVAVF